jgi:uncharacterized phage protein (TIGR02220 family)
MEYVKRSFIMYTDYEELFNLLPREEAGDLIRAVFAYEKRGEIPGNLGSVSNAVFIMIRQDLDENRIRYENRCEANRANGSKGGRPRKEKTENPIGFSVKTQKPKKADNDNDNDNDCDYDNDYDLSKPPGNPSGTHNEKNSALRESIIGYLNNKAGTRYSASGSKTKTSINARIAEGFTEEDFRAVIDKMCTAWIGTEWERYLRPETLFGTKFESYLNAPSQNQPAKPRASFETQSFDTDDVWDLAIARTYDSDQGAVSDSFRGKS